MSESEAVKLAASDGADQFAKLRRAHDAEGHNHSCGDDTDDRERARMVIKLPMFAASGIWSA